MIGVTMRQAGDLTESVAAAVDSQSNVAKTIESSSFQAAARADNAVTNIEELNLTLGRTGGAAKEARSAADDARAQTKELLETTEAFLVRFGPS
jgi:methyl-accepting chemotaxis protein